MKSINLWGKKGKFNSRALCYLVGIVLWTRRDRGNAWVEVEGGRVNQPEGIRMQQQSLAPYAGGPVPGHLAPDSGRSSLQEVKRAWEKQTTKKLGKQTAVLGVPSSPLLHSRLWP